MDRSLRFVLSLFAGAMLLPAQTTSTAILGTVTDGTGAIVAGAKVTATQIGTQIRREDTTSSTGDYNFPLLDVGEYTLEVEATGFKTELRSNVLLRVNEKVRVDFRLSVGTQSERIEVTASAAILRTDEASLGQVVEQKRVNDLPINGRNIANLAILQPGIQYGNRMGLDGQSGGGGFMLVPFLGIALVANGQRETNQHATMDGVVATDSLINTVPFNPSVEAIQEFKVLSGSYSAEYGFNSGAQLMLVTKAGTNDVHGSLFHFFRNEKLDAENYFTNYFNAPGAARRRKDGLLQNQYGLVVSGPVLLPKLYNGKDRTFFMYNFEARNRRDRGISAFAAQPPDDFRQGNLSRLLNRVSPAGAALPSVQILDPITGVPFAGNIIPASRIQTAARNFLNFYPAAQTVLGDPISGAPNFVGETRQTFDDRQMFARVDHQINTKDRIFGRYAHQWFNFGVVPGNNPNLSRLDDGTTRNLATQWLHIFSPSVINEFRYGIMYAKSGSANPRTNTDFDPEATLGIQGFRILNDNNRKFTPRETGLPTLGIQNFAGLSDPGTFYHDNAIHHFSNNLTISRGRHNFKTGFDFRRLQLFRGAANVPRGGLTFNDNIAQNGFAAFLLGYATQTETAEGLPLTDSRQNRYAGYFNDDWRVSRKLTLNLGIRYEYNSTATDIAGLWRSLILSQPLGQGVPVLGPPIRTPFAFYKPQRDLFMPRIGIAYRLTDRWVMRTGYGIYYNVHQLNNYTILNLNPPLSGSTLFVNTATNGVIPQGGQAIYTFQNPFGVLSPTSAIQVNALNPDNFQPVIHQWSIDIQRQLPWNTVLAIGYIGSKGSHIDNTVEANNPDPAINVAGGTTPQQRRPIQFVQDNPGGPIRPLTRLRWLDSGANQWYHGLQVNVEKRLSNGFLGTFAYTYSQSLGEAYGRNEGGGGGSLANTYQNPRNRAAEKGRYPFDVRHNLVLSGVYEIPTPFKQGVSKFVLGGWQTNVVGTFRSGFPFDVGQTNVMNTFNSPARPDRLNNGKLDNPTVNRWFDTEAFRVLTCQVPALGDRCRYGNSGVGILNGPGLQQIDFSGFKNFEVNERFRVQFRAEFFNLFNRPNFAPPNAVLTASPAFLPAAPGQADPVQGGRIQGPGAITRTIAPMRNIQFALKLYF